MHAHPKMISTGSPILPPTVVDQIYLWEQERNRFNFSEGVLYSQFMSQNDFETLRDYAQDLGVLVWQNERKRTMVSEIYVVSLVHVQQPLRFSNKYVTCLQT